MKQQTFSFTGGDSMTAVQDSPKTKSRSFKTFEAYQKLKTLANHPFDLCKEGNLTPERIQKYIGESCGFKLLYGTERITDEVMKVLEELALEAQVHQKMERMQAGDVINRIEGFSSDNRAVLHTAMRDFFDQPNSSKAAVEATALAKKEQEKLRSFLQKIDQEKRFTDLVLIAIGGSELGQHAVYLALQNRQQPDKNIHFISNIDPDNVAQVMRQVNLEKTVVVVVSKSGSTLETATNEAFVRKCFEDANLDSSKHFIAITGKGSPMDDRNKYLECFYSWDFVGGRFSTTAMYGGFLLSFACGYETYWEFLKGAHAMDKAALNRDLKQNLPLLSALLGIWNRNFLGYPTMALVPYSNALSRFSAHIQQVDMESNGKRIDKIGQPVDFETGPIIWGEPGTNAQHSFYQLIHQGTDVVPVELIGFKEDQYGEDFEFKGTTSQEKLLSNLFAQALALALGHKNENPNKVFPGNRPTSILLGKQLTPFAMGALFALYEHKVAFQGFIWNINSFDQEGVMLGKELANKMLERFAQKRQKSIAHQPFPLGDAYLNILDSFQ